MTVTILLCERVIYRSRPGCSFTETTSGVVDVARYGAAISLTTDKQVCKLVFKAKKAGTTTVSITSMKADIAITCGIKRCAESICYHKGCGTDELIRLHKSLVREAAAPEDIIIKEAALLTAVHQVPVQQRQQKIQQE